MFTRLIIGAAIAFSASEAFASKARMMSLGQSGTYGSQYILDTKNIFHNPAYLNDLGAFAQFEFGDHSAGNSGQGGFFQKSGAGFMGVWLGGESASTNSTISTINTNLTSSLPTLDNQWEFFYTGGGNMNWGASFYMADQTDSADAKASSMGLRVGASQGKWDAALVMGLGTSSEDGTVTFTGTTGMKLTAGYMLSAGKVYFNYDSNGFEVEVGGNATPTTATTMDLGFARTWSMDKNTFFYSIAYHTDSTVVDGADPTPAESALPLTVGVEAAANDWLTLRASIAQNILVNSTATGGGDPTTQDNTTDLNAGVGINWGNVMIDGVLSMGDTGRFNFSDDGATEDLMMYTSLTYKF
jgi:hypothetical protein